MSDSTAFEDWLEALPYDERATLCFKKVWDAAQACKDDPQQRTYCLKHYRRTFPEKGCDMCEMEARNETLEARFIQARYLIKKHRYAHGRFPYDELAALMEEPTE